MAVRCGMPRLDWNCQKVIYFFFAFFFSPDGYPNGPRNRVKRTTHESEGWGAFTGVCWVAGSVELRTVGNVRVEICKSTSETVA